MPLVRKPLYRRRRPARKQMRRRPLYRPRAALRRNYHAPKNFVETIRFKELISMPGVDPTTGTGVDTTIDGSSLPLLGGALRGAYRQFCIRGIKWFYIPAYTDYAAQTGIAIQPKIYFAEDKMSKLPDTDSQNIDRIMTQDNVKVFSANKRWSRYVRMPRPELYETGGPSALFATLVQPNSNKVQWLTLQDTVANDEDNSGLSVPHMSCRLVVSSNNGLVNITIGTLWAKVYYSVKEQQIAPPQDA